VGVLVEKLKSKGHSIIN